MDIKLAQTVILPQSSGCCIWCGRRFVARGGKQATDVNFGPVERSDEHVFPASVYGGLLTQDLCRSCNSWFGSHVDLHLPQDPRILEAVEGAGIDIKEFLKSFTATQEADDGRKVGLTYKNGDCRIEPSLKDCNQLSIGSVNGKIDERALQDFRAQLIKKVKQKNNTSDLSDDQKNRIDLLLEKLRNSPDEPHWDDVLREGFRPTLLSNKTEITHNYSPWKAEWCIAKIAFETTVALMPQPFLGFAERVLQEFRNFIQAGVASEDRESGDSIFEFEKQDMCSLDHSVCIIATQNSYMSEVCLFGGALWRFRCNLSADRYPDEQGFKVIVSHPFGSRNYKPSYQVDPV